MKYIIEGGKKLIGEVKISGNKNSVLACMSAALLTDEEVVLENVPDISDVDVMIEIFSELGVKVEKDSSKMVITARDLKTYKLRDELVKRLRASILLAGPLINRMGKVELTFPGGDVIGKRNIEVHLEGFSRLGVNVSTKDSRFALEYPGQFLEGNVFIFFEEASNTAAENLILTSVLSKRIVTLKNCPSEPQIIDLCQMLISMGARIQGAGTRTITIEGVDKLHGSSFRISDDYIELATYVIAAVITGGKIKFLFKSDLDLEPVFLVLKKFGIDLIDVEGGFSVEVKELKGVEKVVTNIWPGFPTDLMSALIVLASQSKGETLCHDWMYESRMFFVDKLIGMGAEMIIADPHRVVVYGPSKLTGRELETPDLRAGMALVLAGLVADGKSIINRAELIERGYEDVVGKLSKLGAKIKREE